MARAVAILFVSLAGTAFAADDNLDFIQQQAKGEKELPDGSALSMESHIDALAEQARSKAEDMATMMAKTTVEEAVGFDTSLTKGEKADDVAEILSKPEQVLDNMMQKSGELLKNFQNMREAARTNLEAQDRLFNQKLQAQRLENEAIAANNKAIKDHITDYERATKEKRRRVEELSAHNDKSRSVLQNMKDELATAQEFVNRSLDEIEVNSPDLLVLQELDDEDATSGNMKEHEQRIDAISAFGKKQQISLLEISGQEQAVPTVTESGHLIKGIATNLVELREEEKQGEANLKASFTERFKAEAGQRANLLKEQDTLNSTFQTFVILDNRLTDAVQHLQQTSDQIEADIRSAEHFSAGIGQKLTKAAAHSRPTSLLEGPSDTHAADATNGAEATQDADDAAKKAALAKKAADEAELTSSLSHDIEAELGHARQVNANAEADEQERLHQSPR